MSNPCSAAFIFLAKGLVPGFYTITQVYKIDVLNFSSTLLGFTDVIAYLGVLLGVVVYNKYLKATPFRKVFTIVSLGLAFVYCFDVILFTHSNRLLFGGDCAPVDNNPQEVACTSDKFFSISDEAISNAADQLKAMPVLVLAARICPKSIEGTLFATLMSLSNLGWDSSQYVGAIVASQIGIKKVSYACEGCVSGGPDPRSYGTDGVWRTGNRGRYVGPSPAPGYLFTEDFSRPNALDDWKGNDRLRGGKTTATIVDDPLKGECPGVKCRNRVLKQNRCVYEGETFSKSTVSCTKAKPCIASFWILQNKGNTAFQGFSSEFAGHHTWTASYQKGFEGTVTDQGWIQKGTDWQFMCFVFPDCEYGGSKNACESHKWVAGSDSADGSNNFDGSKCSVSCTGKPVGCKLCQDPSLKMEHGQHHVHFMIEANGGGADACKSNYWDDFAVVLSPSTTTDSSVRAKCAELKKLGGFKGIVPSKRRPQLCASGALSRLPFLTGSGTKCGGKNAKGKAFIDTNSCPFCTGSVLDYADADPDKIWEKKNTDGSFMVMATQGKSRITVDPVLAYKWASEAQLATRWKKDYAPIEENLWIGGGSR